ncbi:MAG TPA: peptidoglycan-binding domain-containing protein [Kofleriaceae bacterium]|nr:peptidoglycan-binding domain-containing protein [Kofleriaceae bacterium]
MTGPDVLELQTKLKAAGYAVENLDSELGPTTDAAVRAFQHDHQLEVDGVVGPLTLAALTAAAAGGSQGAARLPRPCTAEEAVARAMSILNKGGQYQLGTGDYRPKTVDNQLVDLPWTTSSGGALGSDCAGFALSWCYKIPRHRPGLNVGPWSTCSDDLNCNSALEDADHARDLFARATGRVQPGDLLTYPTITLPDHPGKEWIGHVGIVIGVSRAAGFNLASPDYSLLDIAQCCGPNGRAPAVIRSDGSVWNQHDHQWPLPQHRTVVLRAKG